MNRWYRDDIAAVAKRFNLDPLLVEAIVLQESSGNTDAFRFEPKFYSRYLKIAPDWAWARKKYANPRRISSSYGLMQVMWSTALDLGYPRDWEPERMFVPQIGLEWGCRLVQRLQAWADEGWPQVNPSLRLLAVLAAYNGGKGGNAPGTQLRNGKYAQEVHKRYLSLQDSSQVSRVDGLP